MTGFARVRESQSVEAIEHRWTWELRSVNGKGLDLRLRLPHGFEALDVAVRKSAAQRLSRGNVQAALTLVSDSKAGRLEVNQNALDTVLAAVSQIDSNIETSPSSAAQILALRGVLEVVDAEPVSDSSQALNAAILASFGVALRDLTAHRKQEGAALADILSGHVEEIEKLVDRIEADPANKSDAIRDRLNKQIAALVEDTTPLDQTRLHQEAALLATKADIREELDRLKAHCAAALELIEVGSPAGRKLEFLAQEFNREANTVCSKSASADLTSLGLELKAVIDQFREQVLNVE